MTAFGVLPVFRFVAPEAWMDGNGHVNAAFYQLMVKDAAIAAHDQWGYGPQFHRDTGRSSFVLESHVQHRAEIKAGDRVSVRSRITALDGKRLHLLFEIHNDSTGRLAALVRYLTIHVLLAANGERPPKSAPFPPDLQRRLAELCAAHAEHALPPGAADLPSLGHRP